MRLLTSLLILCFILSPLFAATDQNYPYLSFNSKYPPYPDPFPGVGTNFCTLSKGMQTALWNPASIAAMSLTQISMSYSEKSSTTLSKDSKVAEKR
jgi:hypothetical protein